MESTLKKYARKIERNEINPHVRYDGKKSGLILNPLREKMPLNVLGFGIYRLTSHFIKRETKAKEIVLVPQEGEFEAEVNGIRFSGKRSGGPFALGPGRSNASALYVPSNSRLQIRGKGEMAFFEAPALKNKSPYYLSDQEVKVASRGDWVWRRDVVSLISPKDASSNLAVGETWSPPGFWSGTPPHQHDKDQPSAGESDQEEIYYHRFNWRKGEKDQFGSYGVQILMDGKNLMKAYLIGDKSIFAIPGGCHPVVASPVSESLYLWGLAGKRGELMMRDVPEFVHLKTFEEIFKKLKEDEQAKGMPRERLNALCAPTSLTEAQKTVLAAMLREKGLAIE